MDVAAAQAIGAGLTAIGAGFAAIGMIGAGIGVGNIFANLVTAIARNPSAQSAVQPVGLLGFAVTEAVGLFALVVALLILFV